MKYTIETIEKLRRRYWVEAPSAAKAMDVFYKTCPEPYAEERLDLEAEVKPAQARINCWEPLDNKEGQR